MAQAEPTPAELLASVDTPTARVAANKVVRESAALCEARSILSDILTAYAGCFDGTMPNSHSRLGEALEAGRQHILACGFREMPREPFI